jgi:hypothetical protein
MRQIKLTILVALAAALAAGARADAAEVILVTGDRAVRVNDPFVPSKAEITLGRPQRAVARRGALPRERAGPPPAAPTAAPCSARCAAARSTGATLGAGAAGTRGRFEPIAACEAPGAHSSAT